jgi:dTDP-4-dehydrorhamnose 3,5-epimerase
MSTSPAQPSARIHGVYVVPLRPFSDARGAFFETFRRSWIPEARDMVQGNCSLSKAGALRGLHYHLKQADFWVLPSGRVRAALYDLRLASPTRGAAEVVEMDADRPIALYIPKGVAHGYRALADSLMFYFVDEYYDDSDEHGLRWDDPALGIDWGAPAPVAPLLSGSDRDNPSLADIPAALLPG